MLVCRYVKLAAGDVPAWLGGSQLPALALAIPAWLGPQHGSSPDVAAGLPGRLRGLLVVAELLRRPLPAGKDARRRGGSFAQRIQRGLDCGYPLQVRGGDDVDLSARGR